MMQEHTHEAFSFLAGVYPGWARYYDNSEIGEQMIENWGESLEDLPPKDLMRAVRDLAKTCERPPSVAAIRNAATLVRRGRSIREQIAADKAAGDRE